jgi:hypothetical protein
VTGIDLAALVHAHGPTFEPELAHMTRAAALALQRHHEPGAELTATVDGAEHRLALAWRPIDEAERVAVDEARVTEIGAEAVAIGLAHHVRGWTLRRRMPRRTYADWLVVEAASSRVVALEIGGMDDGALDAKLAGEVEQVKRCAMPNRAACVVRFRDVRAKLVEVPSELE